MGTRSGPGPGRPDPGLSAIMSERRQLINLAYRLLGSLAEAEDAVQETYARWYAMSGPQQQAIASPGAWLTRLAGRICLDLLGSAQARRERYVGCPRCRGSVVISGANGRAWVPASGHVMRWL
jgi:DNA-directed RNA polymerase specialized sigma24 family protein